jgi:hypothetical protein
MQTDNNSLEIPDTIKRTTTQHRVALAVAFCWIIYLIYLLTARVAPELGDWAEPSHLTSSILLALALSAVLSPYFPANIPHGWWTIVTSTAFIVGFECLQLMVPVRAFEFLDIAQGISGAAIAAMSATLISTVIGRSAYVWLALAAAVAVFIGSIVLLTVKEPEAEVSCAEPSTVKVNWDLVVLYATDNELADKQRVETSVGTLCVFDNTQNRSANNSQQSATDSQTRANANANSPTSVTAAPTLQLTGGGLISGNLTGLRQALANSGQITFGVKFKASELEAGRPPRLLASLQTPAGPSSYVARLIQNGPNTSAAFSFQPWQGSSTAIANRLKDRFHEVVITYDGSLQTTYFDGKVVGTEITRIDAVEVEGDELVINIGLRADRRWKPFIGEIQAIVIGATSLSPDQISGVFTLPGNAEN